MLELFLSCTTVFCSYMISFDKVSFSRTHHMLIRCKSVGLVPSGETNRTTQNVRSQPVWLRLCRLPLVLLMYAILWPSVIFRIKKTKESFNMAALQEKSKGTSLLYWFLPTPFLFWRNFYYVAKAGLKLTVIPLPQSPRCCHNKHKLHV